MKLPSPIMNFIIASAVIHVGLMSVSDSSTITLPGSTESVMVVQIKNEQPHEIIKTKRKKKNKSKTQESLKKVTKQKSPPKAENKNQSSTLEVVSISKNMEKSKARVASIIYKELNQYFTYPRLAVKRNWQGKVLLSLRVTSTGKIKNIHLNNSSGYDILDQAAINSLSKVEQLPEVSSWLPFDVDLKFPVIYKLIGG